MGDKRRLAEPANLAALIRIGVTNSALIQTPTLFESYE